MSSRLMRHTAFLCLLAFAGTAHAASPDLNLLLTHETQQLGPDGVTRLTRFSEHFYRRTGVVWLARVLPPETPHTDHQHRDKAQHKHPELGTASRWITQGKNNQASLQLVKDEEKLIIDISPAEYGDFAFSNNWQQLSQLLDPATLKTLKPAEAGKQAGSRWYQNNDKAYTLRILWNEADAYPMQIERRSANGYSRMQTQVIAAPKTLPWQAVASYTRKSYSDLLD